MALCDEFFDQRAFFVEYTAAGVVIEEQITALQGDKQR